MRGLAGGLACMLSIAGCFAPEPREGLGCSRDGDCPPGQDCHAVAGRPEPGVCSSAPPADGGGGGDAGAGAFGAPEPVDLMCLDTACLSPRDPSLTDDRKQLVFTIETLDAPGNHDVYLAGRATAFDPWGTAAPAGAIDSLYVEEGSWVSGDGLALYFTRDDQNVGGPPYGDLWVSNREAVTDPFDTLAPVAGVVNTSHGNERGAARTQDGSRLLFARALDLDVGDHDVYIALESGGQWDTVARLEGVSAAGSDERSLALAEEVHMLFVSRGERIVEAHWSGGNIASAEVVSEHEELVVPGAELISGVWIAPDGSEIWFGACGTSCAIYRAVR